MQVDTSLKIKDEHKNSKQMRKKMMKKKREVTNEKKMNTHTQPKIKIKTGAFG